MSERSVVVSFRRTASSIRPYCAQISLHTATVVSRTGVSAHGGGVPALWFWAASDDASARQSTAVTRATCIVARGRGGVSIAPEHTAMVLSWTVRSTDDGFQSWTPSPEVAMGRTLASPPHGQSHGPTGLTYRTVAGNSTALLSTYSTGEAPPTLPSRSSSHARPADP